MFCESPRGPWKGRGGLSTSRRRKRHSPEQIIGKLRDADAMLAGGKTIGGISKAMEIAEATFHCWRKRAPTRKSLSGGMKAEEARRLKKLEEANQRRKRLLAEAELDKAILHEALGEN